MTDELPTSQPVEPPHQPIGLRDRTERHAHIAKRMFERAGIIWTPEQVAALEGKVRLVRSMCNDGKVPAPILPTKIGESELKHVHYYRAYAQGKPVTFVWSQLAKCLISFAGPGELPNGIEEPVSTAPDPFSLIAVMAIHATPGALEKKP